MTTETRHTPGPWRACHDGKCSCKLIMGEHHPIAKVESGKWGDEYPALRLVGPSIDQKAETYMDMIEYGKIDEDVAEANARLIAAAPELMEACKYVVSFHREHDSGNGELFGLDFVTTCIAAISKAEPPAG